MLQQVAAEIRRRFDEFVEAEMADTGQPRHVMEKAFVPRGAANFDHFAEEVKVLSTETFELEHHGGTALNYGIRRPKGVIGVICPWNAPFLPDDLEGRARRSPPATPWSSSRRSRRRARPPCSPRSWPTWACRRASTTSSTASVPTPLARSSLSIPGVDAITFTGETTTGTAIMKAAAEGVRDVSFELGGKNSAVVFADADFEAAVDGVFRSAFLNSGQVCLGTERVFVERPIFERFRDALAERARNVTYGAPTDHDADYGPLISKEHQEKVLGYYDRAVAEGATVVVGGGVPEVAPGARRRCRGSSRPSGPTPPTAPRSSPRRSSGPCCHLAPFDDEHGSSSTR